MILVDSSVWVDHLRTGEPTLVELLNSSKVLVHPFVVGELACGNLKNRKVVLPLLQDLPTVPVATDEEVLFFIERHGPDGAGYWVCRCPFARCGCSDWNRATLDTRQTSWRDCRINEIGFPSHIDISRTSHRKLTLCGASNCGASNY